MVSANRVKFLCRLLLLFFDVLICSYEHNTIQLTQTQSGTDFSTRYLHAYELMLCVVYVT